MVAKGEAFLARLRAFLDRAGRPAADRARRTDPRRRHRGAQGARRARDEDPRGVRRARPLAGLLQPRAGAGRHLALRARRRCSPPTSRSACPSRCACSAPRSRSASGCRRSPRTHVSAFLLTEPDVGSDPARMSAPRDPDRGRHAATASPARSCGPPTARSPTSSSSWPSSPSATGQGRHHRVHLPLRRRGRHGRGAATRSWACAASRTRVTRFDDVFVPARERHRRRGQGPQDRAGDAEHRPPVAAGDLRGDRPSTR